MTTLPGGLSTASLTEDLRRHLGRPGLVVARVTCTPIDHQISAPTTGGLARVAVETTDGDVVRLVAKSLQAARYGLPPVIPAEVRAHLDAIIPWRQEIDVLTGMDPDRAPAGLRLPVVVAVHEQPDDRATLWTEDVRPVARPWTDEDTVQAAHALGRLAARRRDDPQSGWPGEDFLATWCANQLAVWAVPQLLDERTWAHPAFTAPAVAALRLPVTELARTWTDVARTTTDARRLPAHGDPTPMNLLVAPDGWLVPIDWGTATSAPIGWDLVPLVFGRAEAGVGDVGDLAGTLDLALAAHREGLVAGGVEVDPAELRRVVVAAALLRYPMTCLPLGALDGQDEGVERTVRRAGFVRAVLDLDGR